MEETARKMNFDGGDVKVGEKQQQNSSTFMNTHVVPRGTRGKPSEHLSCAFTAKLIDMRKKKEALVHGLSYPTKEINLLSSAHPLSPATWKPSGIGW